jgi:transcriptional regulator with XRE-family HTH domain
MWTGNSSIKGDESLGARIRRLRMAKGLSQTDFAAALSVSTTAVCNWELDRTRPKISRLQAVASVLGVPANALLGRDSAGGLQEKLAQSREEIARLAGTTADKVRIIIEV